MSDILLPNYTPIYPITKVVKPRQKQAKMPEWGIEQRATVGQNQTSAQWSISWLLPPNEANILDNFFAERAREGQWFLWTSPNGTLGRYRCEEWVKEVFSHNRYRIKATFRQVYNYIDISVNATVNVANLATITFTCTGTGATTITELATISTNFISGGVSVSTTVSSSNLGTVTTTFSGQGATNVAVDPNFTSVLLLLHGDGADNGTVFTDSSGYARTVTAADIGGGAATAVTKTAVKQYGTASILINGGQDYLSVPHSADWNFGSGDFTFEAWIYITGWISGNPGEPQGIMCRGSSNVSNPSFAFSVQPGNGTSWQRGLIFTIGTSSSAATVYTVTEVGQFALNTWHHVAASRNGANLRLFANGTQIGATQNVSTTTMYHPSNQVFEVGRNYSFSNSILGYVDDVRVTKGVARYTANFTAPSAAFPDS